MAEQSGGKWKKDQKVEIYNQSQKKWIPSQIFDIRNEDGQHIYCVKHNEWSRPSFEISAKDASSMMRIAKDNKTSKHRNARKAFIQFSEHISDQFPVSRQIRVLTDNSRGQQEAQSTS